MPREIYDEDGHAHFVTFSCFKKRRLLDHDKTKEIVLSVLEKQLTNESAHCFGFVIMPNHVHAVLWFSETGSLASFMKAWKQQTSFQIKQFFTRGQTRYSDTFDLADPIWQARYYDFNVYSERKLQEKLQYMHENPVRAGLIATPSEWPFSSARFYETGESVGVQISYPA
jgi:putative transposase